MELFRESTIKINSKQKINMYFESQRLSNSALSAFSTKDFVFTFCPSCISLYEPLLLNSRHSILSTWKNKILLIRIGILVITFSVFYYAVAINKLIFSICALFSVDVVVYFIVLGRKNSWQYMFFF